MLRKVESGDIGRLSIVHYILRESADFTEEILATVGEVGGVALSYVCLYCRCLPLEDCSWWASSGHVDGNNREEETMQVVVPGLWWPV